MSSSMAKGDRLIVALDVPTYEQAMAWVERLPQVAFWKVGLELFVATGGEVISALKQRQKRIFLDLKLHDIPNTVAGAVRSATQYEVDLLTLHATAGKRALESAVEAVAQTTSPRPRLLGITLLTSLNARELAFELKVPLELSDYALQMALLCQEAGLDGVVCSPQEAKQLREICDRDFLLVCPGVRPRSSQRGDQQRVMTPRDAFNAGADYLVIGRPITAAADPLAAWEQICQEIAVD